MSPDLAAVIEALPEEPLPDAESDAAVMNQAAYLEFRDFALTLTADKVSAEPALLSRALDLISHLPNEQEHELGIGLLHKRVKPAVTKNGIEQMLRKLRGDDRGSSNGDTGGSGRPTSVETIEPWPSHVDGTELANEISATIKRFAVLPDRAPEAIALWVLHAWAFDAWSLSPILAFTAPVKRSGKSNALFLVGYMCPRRFITANLTDAAGFRLIEKYQITVILDEVDKLMYRDSNVTDTLINGYLRASAVVARCSGENHEPLEFSCWCPKAVALIGRLRPDTLHDRSIEIQMRPKLREEVVERRRDAKLPQELLPLRRKAMRWAVDNLQALRQAEPFLPEELHDRAQDNWEPLLAVADALGQGWAEKARAAAVALSGASDTEVERLPIRLLLELRDEVLPAYRVAADGSAERFPNNVIQGSEIVERLTDAEDSPWREITRGKPITGAKIARLLKPFGLVPMLLWDPSRQKSVRGYKLGDLLRVFERYLQLSPLPGCQGVRKPDGTGDFTVSKALGEPSGDTLPNTLHSPNIPINTGVPNTLTPCTGEGPEERKTVPSGRKATPKMVAALADGKPSETDLIADIMELIEQLPDGRQGVSSASTVKLGVDHGRKPVKNALAQLGLIDEPGYGHASRAAGAI